MRLAYVLIVALWSVFVEAKESVTVLTAYPEEVVSHFETAFEQTHPEFDVQILWRMPHDALPYLSQPEQGGVDVYWSASLRTFQALKRQGAWRKLDVTDQGLPTHLGALPLADRDGFYRATEMAGYGFALNPAYLKKHQLPVPIDWKALADQRYQGHLALPVPSKVGFAPMMIDSVLQQYGWDQGWALLAEIVANAKPVEAGSTFVSDMLGSGERGIAPTIDFFTASAIANGAPLQFSYAQPVAYSPAHIAITQSSKHSDAAKQFVAFLLSEAGQKLLFHADIRKLPVRPDVYGAKPADYFDPFAASLAHPVVYDPETALPRLGLNNALFDAMFTEHWPRVLALFERLRQWEARGGDAAKANRVWALLTTAPISAEQAKDQDLQALFAKRGVDASTEAKGRQWSEAMSKRYDEAEQLLNAAAQP